MKKFKVLIAIVGALILTGCGQQNPAHEVFEEELALSKLNPKNIWTHVTFLADDAMEGRDTGSQGHLIAGNYVQSQFSLMGLKPIGGKSFIHPIPFRSTQLEENGASVTLVFDSSEFPGLASDLYMLKFLEDFLTFGSAVGENLSVTAPLVFAGFGTTATNFNYDDYKNIDATGKIVIVISGGPQSLPSDYSAHFGSTQTLIENAADHGAVGIIFISSTAREARLPWERMKNFITRPSLTWVGSDGNVGSGNPQIKAGITIKKDVAKKIFEFSGLNFEKIFANAENGDVRSFELKGEATISTKSKHSTLDSFNVISVLEGTDPVLKDEYVIYTAHLDHIGITHGGEGDLINNGAYDNATGVSIMLETARLMSMPENRPKRSVIFAAVTAEEKGLLGSAYMAKYPPVSAKKIIANVNIDMPILAGPTKDIIAWGSEHSTLQGVVERAAEKVGLYLGPDPWPEQGIFTRSDQYSFVKEGIPAVMLAPGIVPGDDANPGTVYLDKFLSSNYHKPSDDLNQPFDLKAAVRFSAVNYLIGLELANSPQTPKWLNNNFFGDTFAKDHDSGISD